MSLRRHMGLVLALLGSGMTAQGCGTDCPNCPGPPARVVISPAVPSVLPNDVVQLRAVVVDGDGRLLAGYPAQWSSLDLGVATVDTSGRVVAGGAAGTARIVARMAGLVDTSSVQVVTTSTYSQQVYPILVAGCGLGGCHVTPGPPPTLNASVLASYTQLTTPANGYVTPGDTTVGKLLARLRGDTTAFMPPQEQLSTLAPGDYHLIAMWIAQGALNN